MSFPLLNTHRYFEAVFLFHKHTFTLSCFSSCTIVATYNAWLASVKCVYRSDDSHFHDLYTHTPKVTQIYILSVWLTLSRSLRRAILLLTSSCARSSFSCSKRMFASCKRRFSRWMRKRKWKRRREQERQIVYREKGRLRQRRKWQNKRKRRPQKRREYDRREVKKPWKRKESDETEQRKGSQSWRVANASLPGSVVSRVMQQYTERKRV